MWVIQTHQGQKRCWELWHIFLWPPVTRRMLGKQGPPRHFPLCVSHTRPWSRGPCPNVCLDDRDHQRDPGKNNSTQSSRKNQFTDLCRPPTHTPHHRFHWTTQGQCLAQDCILNTSTMLIAEQAFSNHISTGWIGWAVGVAVRKLQYLISTTAKVHSCQALKLQGQQGKGSW